MVNSILELTSLLMKVKQTQMNTKEQLVNKLVSGSKQTWEVVCEAFELYATTHDATKVFQLQLNADLTKDTWDFAVKQSGGVGFSKAATDFVLDLGVVGKGKAQVRYITESHVKRAKMVLGQVEHWGKVLDKAHRYFEIVETPTTSKVKAHKGMLDYTVKFRKQAGELLIIKDIRSGKANLSEVNNRNGNNNNTDKSNTLVMFDSNGKSINITKTRTDAQTAIGTYTKAEDNAAGEKSKVKAEEKLAAAIDAYRAVIKKAIEDHNDLIENCSGLRADKMAMPKELSNG